MAGFFSMRTFAVNVTGMRRTNLTEGAVGIVLAHFPFTWGP